MLETTLPAIGTATADTDEDGDVIADFIAAAGAFADRTALVHNGTTIPYRDVEDRVRTAASRYGSIRSDTGADCALIGALVSHTPAVVDHLLGILRAGAAYCPIDAALPVARREALAGALGVDRLYAATRTPHEGSELSVVALDELPAPTDPDLRPHVARPNDPAYVLCTSGSTGAPKPVVVSRRAVTATVRALRHLFMLGPGDRVLQFASLGWDTCLEEILPALTAGATLVFDDAAHSGSLPAFVRMLAEHEVTVLDVPTAFWHELVLFLHEERRELPAGVRLVVIGGERVDPTRLREWRELDVAHVRLLNTYGCTETTMVTHAVQLWGPGTEPAVAALHSDAPLGRALAQVRDHVTDEGELLVSGPILATGYLGLPEATAAGFPVTDHGSGRVRWFRTGDLVVRAENGLLYSRGRVDEQVKVLGVRVHPAEVEAQLTTHPAVTGAVVVGERLCGRTSLTAYVVPAGPVTAAELKRHLRARLPSQFVPTRMEFVTALAYTASGKVDRAATRRAATTQHTKGAGE